jgi:AcrR family transcriptional regulator
MSAPPARATRAGRPRNADATARVLRATLELLDRQGLAGLRIDDIARASGVAKTTIYRRWPSMTALVVAAMEVALGPRDLPETGDVEADLTALLTLIHESMSRAPFGRALPLISIELMTQPGLAEQYRARVIDPVREQGIRLIRTGIEQGRFRPDTDPALVVDAVAAPLLFRQVVLHQTLSLAELLAVGEMIIRSIRV